MQNFDKISLAAFDGIFEKIGKEWMLITAKGKTKYGKEAVNTMTASWGGYGILWNLPVAFLFVRPQRFTFSLLESSDAFSLSFLPEEKRAALLTCGTLSGKNVDKWKASGLTPLENEGVPFVGEARTVLFCRKLYAAPFLEEGFINKELLQNYRTDDFHQMYIAEIESVFSKKE